MSDEVWFVCEHMDLVFDSPISWCIKDGRVVVQFDDVDELHMTLFGLDAQWMLDLGSSNERMCDIVMWYLRDFEKLVRKYDRKSFTDLGVLLEKAQKDVDTAKKAPNKASVLRSRFVRDAIRFSQTYPVAYRMRAVKRSDTQLSEDHEVIDQPHHASNKRGRSK